jgi:serine/threonine protein phosphatase PrpC
MGTTLCCVHLQPEGVVYGHVGDSRIYRFRAGVLLQLTDDHSLLREMIQRGQIQDQPRDTFALKNIITKAIGTGPVVEPSINITDIHDQDIILMCSDGLSDLMSQEDIQEVLATTTPLRQVAHRLVSLAKTRGGMDNITIVLIKAQNAHAPADISR